MSVLGGPLADEGFPDPQLSSPFLFIPLFEGDVGALNDRFDANGVLINQILDRRPTGVAFQEGRFDVTVANSGTVASDLVKLDYQIVFCRDPDHQRDQGFTMDHAAVEHGPALGEPGQLTLVQLLPGETFVFPVVVDDPGFPLANIYLRARVSTIWSEYLEPNSWDFETDGSVTEFTARLVP